VEGCRSGNEPDKFKEIDMCFRMLTLRNSLLILTLALSVVASAQTVESTLYTWLVSLNLTAA
jgi:hypothetical protein